MKNEFPKTLKKGDKGPAVALLQLMLLAANYGTGEIHVDGDFGEKTEAAVKEYQTDAGLEGDPEGEAGESTLKDIFSTNNVDLGSLDLDIFAPPAATEEKPPIERPV